MTGAAWLVVWLIHLLALFVIAATIIPPPTRRLVTILFIALLCAGMVLLLFSATPVNGTDLTWSWYAGIGCVAVAALIAALNGWAT